MKSTSFPMALTIQSCRTTWSGYNSCTFPTFALKDTTANAIICSSGATSATPTDKVITPTTTMLPANDVLAFLATTNGTSCTAGGTQITAVMHQ
jgi:hypothetical protein